jgi:hypothetical protein
MGDTSSTLSGDIAHAVSRGGVLLSMQSSGLRKPPSVDSEPDFVGYNQRFQTDSPAVGG